jgi:phosphoribosyl-ATP pyrophosphohydrolase/phosphoribosyl-AMP cyclohydrolase
VTPEQIGGLDWSRDGGRLPAVVQDAGTGEVRMLGWMDRAALEATLASGRVTFFSRSRGVLWTKGETSGNSLELVSVTGDCDGDALLIVARPAGPTCHSGAPSCFEAPAAAPALLRLERTIRDRLATTDADPAPGGYTARLAAGGVARVAQKVGEEAVETALAAATGGPEALVGEAADLVYHLLVLLALRGRSLADVAAELDRRASERGVGSRSPG